MAVELKTEAFGARVTGTKAKQVNDYLEATGLRQTEFVRAAMDEYMANHPAPEAAHE